MNDDELRALRDKLRREQAMTPDELLLRPSDDEPNWLGACVELVAEIDRLRLQSPLDRIRAILAALPDEPARVAVLEQVLENRCRRCLDYDPQGQFWCCYDSRGG